jgi:outer membrane lipoprotein SlyB
MFQKQMTKVTSNPIGAIAGGVAGFYAAKKFGNVSNMWVLAGVAVLGVVVGANVQSMMKAKSSAPTAAQAK